jgi:hypothetical protein
MPSSKRVAPKTYLGAAESFKEFGPELLLNKTIRTIKIIPDNIGFWLIKTSWKRFLKLDNLISRNKKTARKITPAIIGPYGS